MDFIYFSKKILGNFFLLCGLDKSKGLNNNAYLDLIYIYGKYLTL